jgi:hypothetical protein
VALLYTRLGSVFSGRLTAVWLCHGIERFFFNLIYLVSCADRCGRASKIHMTFARWNIGVAYSSPTQDMDMYGRFSSLLLWNK